MLDAGKKDGKKGTSTFSTSTFSAAQLMPKEFSL
jgi:hypothetical protein